MEKGLIVHAAIVNNKRDILVLKRSSQEKVLPGVWDIPGGTLEDDEDPTDGVKREVLEETNLNVRDLELFAYTSNVDRKKNKQFVRLIFACHYESGEIKLNPAEHEDYRWIAFEDVNKLNCVEYLVVVVNALTNNGLAKIVE